MPLPAKLGQPPRSVLWVDDEAELLEPHRLCAYLFELAQLFTSFYDQCPVLKAEESVRESRLALCGLVLRRLSSGLDLLGIETPENM